MYSVFVVDMFDNFICATAVSSWLQVEEVYFRYLEQYPVEEIKIRKVSLDETTLGV